MTAKENMQDDRWTVTTAGLDLLARQPRRSPDADVMPKYEDFSQEEVVVRPPESPRAAAAHPSRVDRKRSD